MGHRRDHRRCRDVCNLLGLLGVAAMVGALEVDPMARVSRLEGAILVGVALLGWGLDFSVRAT